MPLLASDAKRNYRPADKEAAHKVIDGGGVSQLKEETRLDDLASLLEERLRQAGLEIAGPTSFLLLEDYPESCDRQTVMFLFGQGSEEPCAVAKVSSQASQRTVLAREFTTLVDLHEKLDPPLRATIPEPICLIEPDRTTVLLETFQPGRSIYFDMRNSWRPRARASGHFRRAGEWLVRFQRATKIAEAPLNDETIEEFIVSPLEDYERALRPSPPERDLIDRTLRRARELRGERLPLVSRQGDFWARNVFVDESSIGVVDWEHFRDRSMPFSDLFMFATSYGLGYPWKLARWADPVAAFTETMLIRSWLARLVRDYLFAYCRAMEVSPKFLEVFLPVFLAQRALEQSPRAGADDRPSQPNVWRQLFAAYAESTGSWCFA